MRSDVIGDVSWEPLLIHCGVMTFKYDSAIQRRRSPSKSECSPVRMVLNNDVVRDQLEQSARCGTACYLAFMNGFATSRAQPMKSCPTGFGVRFFKVMIPTRYYWTDRWVCVLSALMAEKEGFSLTSPKLNVFNGFELPPD